MADKRTTAKEFHATDGVEDWRVLFWGAYAYFRAASFEEGARFISAIADVAGALDHFPDADLRPEGVSIRTSSTPEGALSERDIELCRRISEVARGMGLESDPAQVQVVGIAVAQDTGADTRPFWAAALGYEVGTEDALDRHRRWPHVSFQGLKPPKPGRGRTHIDVSVPADQVDARVAAALAAGGRIADDRNAPYWYTLASPENHKVDIAAWPDFEDDDVWD